ncbi:PDZ domain-containing protein [Pseudogemmatithrix spongiicola]|uniref:PDZ domain-containing protein n=1 Tax=Pseudogemmatithrix spongiicola TaxID=3062599 RepID=A0AA49Q5X8_9BACT|nr:PDZ domain-containing protein [Gemmatimonadaceae bacterium 'strain 138']WKW16329.1 PDZ domain-containing protein [Gemmatimonadaceae bacterium 'strain 318']
MRAIGLRATAVLALVATPAFAQQTSVSATSPAMARTRAADANAEEMLRLVNELRAREARLLRELAATPESEAGTRRNIEQQLARTAREAFAVMSVIESRCLEQRIAPPRGHLGVTIDNDLDMRDGRVARSVANIASVEPGSPAATAGLQAGDRLISIAGRDFSNGMPRLGDLLEPGRRIVVRIQRDGLEREVPVVVGQGTPRMDPACPEYERVMQPLRMGTIARVWVRDTSDGQGNRVVTVLPTPRTALVRSPNPPPPPPAAPNAPTATAAPTPPVPPAAPATPGVYVFGYTRGATSEFAYYNGAQLRQLDDDWRNVLGLRSGTEGVLVNEVAPGSAAAAAGLKSGDVILSVDGNTATSPLVVVRMLSLDDRDETRLRVIRARDTRTVVFKRGDAPRE